MVSEGGEGGAGRRRKERVEAGMRNKTHSGHP